jgi:glycosyltransferase involved in cell wall biosynthesis
MQRGVLDPRALAATIKWLRAHAPQALLTFNYPADVLGRIAAVFGRVPVVIGSLRSLQFGGPHRDLLLRITDRLVSVNVANSRSVADALCARGVVRPHRVTVIPNGLSTAAFTTFAQCGAAARRALPVPPEAFCWVAVGRLDTPKDYPNLLQAFALVRGNGIDPHLCIAGIGSSGSLSSLASELGVAHRVHFLGLRRDVPELLHASDAFVMSSAWEGLPNAVMEAMACSLPVVATQVGGVRELVQEGINGYVVPPRSPRPLADAMERVMSLLPHERRQMGAAGLEYILTHLELEHVIDAWETLLNRWVTES